MALGAGDVLGSYEIVRVLGRGSFGVVLLAEDTEPPHQHHALKMVHCDHLDTEASAKARKVALAEAELLRKLRHPNIVSCHEMRWEPIRSVVWLALDYMDGGDLGTYLEAQKRAGEAPPFASLQQRVLAAVGSALVYIHSSGVLHRDVKPCNVLLSHGFQEIKLADFGISKILEVTGHANTVVGTPHYLSPEIVCGEPYGPPSDAWALGVCLYEVASLRRPFEASNQLALVRRIMEHRPSVLPPSTAPDISRAVFGLLEKRAQERMSIPSALAVSNTVKALVPPLQPAPGPALQPAPQLAPLSSRASSVYTEQTAEHPVFQAEGVEEPDLVRGTSDASIVSEVELVEEERQPTLLPEELAGLTPRREGAFGLDDRAPARQDSKKAAGRHRSWLPFGFGLRLVRSREGRCPGRDDRTVISAFSDEADGATVEVAPLTSPASQAPPPVAPAGLRAPSPRNFLSLKGR